MQPTSTALQPGEHTVTVENRITLFRYGRENRVENGVRTIRYTALTVSGAHNAVFGDTTELHTEACAGCWPCQECGRSVCLCVRDECLAALSGAPVAEADDDTEAF